MKTVIKTNAADEAKSAVEDAQRTARSTARDAGSRARWAGAQARSAVGGARKTVGKTARKTYLRGRIAAARATASRRTTTSKKGIAAAGAAGAAGAYFLDPQEGNRRRKQAVARVTSLFRKGGDKFRRQAEYRKSQAEGKVEALKSKARPEKGAANDQQLAERVKSEIFQPADAPKDKVSVNVERGVVYLRGEVPKENDISRLVQRAGKVDGVNGVESLLHSS
jgi:osmotically-inducible protein OsmY